MRNLFRRFRRRKLVIVDEQAWRDLLAAAVIGEAAEIVMAEEQRFLALDLQEGSP
jgi:hypothetical protein